MEDQHSSTQSTPFSNYHDLYIGYRDGMLHPPTDDDPVNEIRAVMQRLEVGDRIVYVTPSRQVVEPVTVTAVRQSVTDTQTERIEIAVEGPSGGQYTLVDQPQDASGNWDRPRVFDGPATDESNGRWWYLTTLVLVSGDTTE
jgi:hypothetical protein